MALVDTGLLVRYYVDEAASGDGPANVLDASGNGYDVPIQYGVSSLFLYTEVSGNRGLECTSEGAVVGCIKSVSDASDILRDNLHGTQKATIEIVFDPDVFSAGGSRLLSVHPDDSGTGNFTLRATSLTVNQFAWENTIMRTWDPSTSARQVVHIVVDTTLATANDRVKIYVNGTLQSPTINSNPALNDTLTLAASSFLNLWCRGDFATPTRAPDGTLFYAAIYNSAFSQADVTTNFDILTADDDTPAGGIVLLAGTAAAVSSLAGTLPVDKALGGIVPAVAALAGDLPVSRLMVSTVAAVSSLAGALPVEKGLAATIPATSTVTGALALEWALAGTVPGVSTLAGELTLAGEQLLDGVVVATSTLSGQLPVDKPIAGIVAAVSTLDAILGKYRAIDGSIDAVSALTGDLQRLRALVGAIAGGSTLAGALKLEWALRGILAGVSAVPGRIEVERQIAALVAASATLTGELSVAAIGVPWKRENLLKAADISGPRLPVPHKEEIE